MLAISRIRARRTHVRYHPHPCPPIGGAGGVGVRALRQNFEKIRTVHHHYHLAYRMVGLLACHFEFDFAIRCTCIVQSYFYR